MQMFWVALCYASPVFGVSGGGYYGTLHYKCIFRQMIYPSRGLWAWNGQSTVPPINLVRVFVCPSTSFINSSWQNRAGNRVI